MVDLALRTELAVYGLRAEPPLNRRSGAGPSDDGQWLLGGLPASVPIAPDSPWERSDEGVLTRDGVVVESELAPIKRPRFYDLETAEGVPYHQIARLHGRHVLATTVVQTCVRYHETTRCRFCTIEESLRAGTTTEVKRPEQIAEVAVAAVRLDGVRQLVMTTGTSNGPDRGAKHLGRCVEAVRRVIPRLPIQVQVEPPAGLGWIARLHKAGATSIGIHIESLDEEVRKRWTPGKATVPLERYDVVWTEAVRVLGRKRRAPHWPQWADDALRHRPDPAPRRPRPADRRATAVSHRPRRRGQRAAGGLPRAAPPRAFVQQQALFADGEVLVRAAGRRNLTGAWPG